MSASSCREAKLPSLILSVKSRKKCSARLSQDDPVDVKCMRKWGWRASHALTDGWFAVLVQAEAIDLFSPINRGGKDLPEFVDRKNLDSRTAKWSARSKYGNAATRSKPWATFRSFGIEVPQFREISCGCSIILQE